MNKTKKTVIIITLLAVLLAVFILSCAVIGMQKSNGYDTDWMVGKPMWLIKLRYGGFDYTHENAPYANIYAYNAGIKENKYEPGRYEQWVWVIFDGTNTCTHAKAQNKSVFW